ncbi:MAG: EAL domain-containing protein, partial [Poseidonibacter sp.]|uniref:EAL domain-containing protein n=1 Tax=Poseidonibacter sp. TaxID=2321188 RepID=UPI00359ED929
SFVLKSIENILKTKDYNVILAKDPIIALEILKKEPINLILSDLEMPKMSGIEFLETVKKDELLKNIPVLILSGSQNRENYSKVLKHGAIDFIKKPFLVEEILLKTDLHISQSDYINQIMIQSKELEEYKRILNESDIISKTDANGRIKEVNNKFCEISGYSQEYLLGKSHKVVRHPDTPKKIFEDMWSQINEHKTFKGIIKNLRRDGTSYYVDATISPVIGVDGKIKEIIGVRHDISDVMNPKKQLIADLSYIEHPTLIFLQIVNYDLFKEFYSETTMHIFEFELEQVILNYFPSDSGLNKVYNLSNGLFGFLKNKSIDEDSVKVCLKSVIAKFKELGISFKETHYDIDVCLSFANEGNHILDDVYLGIQHAVKNKLNIVYAKNFHRRVQIEARNKLKSVTLIKDALNNKGNFVSFFQPIVNNKTNKIEKYESLIRLVDIDKKIISPFHFLDIAKKTGYYSNITKIVIDNSFKALSYTDKEITINLSSSDIENKQIRNYLWVLVSKKEHRGRITFELLEDEEVKDFNLVKDFIIKCKLECAVKIAIDDFGSGYSNYERLLEFQPDILKIDGSLIKNIVSDEYSLHVVESIIHFAQKQSIKTVAEFVSSKEIFEKIKDLGIDYSQGYYLGEPQNIF